MTVNVRPATIIVPVRVLVSVFAAAVKLTRPLPWPDDPPVIVIQAVVLVAFQAQPGRAVTEIELDAADAVSD